MNYVYIAASIDGGRRFRLGRNIRLDSSEGLLITQKSNM